MELMEGLTVVATESNGGIGSCIGVAIMGLVVVAFGGWLLFGETTVVYTVIADNSVSLNQVLEQYEILECDGNMLKIQLRD